MEEATDHADTGLAGASQRHIIERPRLTKLLDGADARIILLVAPAGYGKTTLAREWTSQRGRTGLWYRARRGASDVAIVARSLSQALAPLSSTIERSTRELLSALNTPEEEPEVVADLLVEELDGWPDDTWLVIDEYELVAPHPAPVRVLERFVAGSAAKVIITGRERPRWVTPRDVLYGDAFEVRAAALSMTLDEASQVLAHAGHPSAGLVALADGWPAVIGLAALLPGEVKPTSDEQPALFDYVAQELFDELAPDAQKHLVLLSVPSTLTPSLVQAVLGYDAERVLRESERVGFMTAREPNEIEIHPLCRTFLEQKLWDIGVSREQIDKLTLSLIGGEQWDDAFEAIRAFVLEARLPLLIEHGLRRVLAEGRTSAVEHWIEWADQRDFQTPEVALARAELFLRRGDWTLSETLASKAAPALDSEALVAQAHLCAGSSAQLLDEVERAWEHFGNALSADAPPDIRRRALWGRFVASSWTRRPEYQGALADLDQHVDTSPDHLLRLGQAKLVVAERKGHLSEALASALAVEPLLDQVNDPFIRTGFLNNLSHALGLAARYAEAERAARRQLEEAKHFRPTFAVPAGLINLAVAHLGLGSLAAAAAAIEQVETHDSALRIKRDTVRACIALARGDSRRAAADLRAMDLENGRSDLVCEALAVLALAEACIGDRASAEAAITAATAVPTDVAPTVFVSAAAAILACTEDAALLSDRLGNLAAALSQTESYDTLICALRGSPNLLEVSLNHADMRSAIRVAALNSGDTALARALGLSPTKSQKGLSPREIEVLKFAGEGFNNAQIGQRLFISPKTVKTHLQNIYEKLGARSRTEAAMKAKEAGLLG